MSNKLMLPNNDDPDFWKKLLRILIAILTALLGALGTSAIKGKNINL